MHMDVKVIESNIVQVRHKWKVLPRLHQILPLKKNPILENSSKASEMKEKKWKK